MDFSKSSSFSTQLYGSNRQRSGLAANGKTKVCSRWLTSTLNAIGFARPLRKSIVSGARKTAGVPSSVPWVCFTDTAASFDSSSQLQLTLNSGCPIRYTHWSKNQSMFRPVSAAIALTRSWVITLRSWLSRV